MKEIQSQSIVPVVFVPIKKTSPNRPSDGKFMAVLRDCSRFRVLHTGRPGNFCWNEDKKLLWARSCSLETRQ